MSFLLVVCLTLIDCAQGKEYALLDHAETVDSALLKKNILSPLAQSIDILLLTKCQRKRKTMQINTKCTFN